MQNSFVESFNGRMRDELLNEHLFDSLRHARNLVAAWRPSRQIALQSPDGQWTTSTIIDRTQASLA